MVTSFLWQKWQNISNDVRQNLRSGGIFTITATRAILTAFDAKLDRTMDDEENNNTTSNNSNMTSTSCHTQDHWFWNPANGTFRLHRKDDWEVGTVSTLMISLWLLLLILRSCSISTKYSKSVFQGFYRENAKQVIPSENFLRRLVLFCPWHSSLCRGFSITKTCNWHYVNLDAVGGGGPADHPWGCLPQEQGERAGHGHAFARTAHALSS